MKNLWKKVIGWALCLMMAVGMLSVAAREAKAADTDAGAGEGIVWNAEKKYYKRIGDYESAVAHNRFYKIIKLGESTSGKLTLNNLTQHGLKQAPLGAHILSDSSSDRRTGARPF